MREAVTALYERDAKIMLPDGDMLQTRFVSSIVWAADKNTIKVNFAPKILPYLTMLKGNFTRYKLENVVQLTSFYAVRIYELIVYWSGNDEFKQKQIEIDELKQILDIQEKYNQFGQFREKVIEIAINQINENTDLLVDVEFKKFRRSFKWIIFTWSRKEKAIKTENLRKQCAEHNHQAKERRIYHEKKQESANEKAENLAAWKAVPIGAQYQHEDGTVWIKEMGGFFHCVSLRKTAAPAQVPVMLASGKFVPLDSDVENIDSVMLSDEKCEQLQKDLEDELNQKNLRAYKVLPMEEAPQKTLSEKLTEMWKSGLISKDEFLELIEKF